MSHNITVQYDTFSTYNQCGFSNPTDIGFTGSR